MKDSDLLVLLERDRIVIHRGELDPLILSEQEVEALFLRFQDWLSKKGWQDGQRH